MGVLEDAVLRAKDAADFAGKKTSELVELSRLKISASSVERKINNEFLELGKMVYKAAKEHTDCTDYVTEKAVAIDALYDERAEIQRKINALRNVKKCPQCSHDNPSDAEYCSKCGAKL